MPRMWSCASQHHFELSYSASSGFLTVYASFHAFMQTYVKSLAILFTHALILSVPFLRFPSSIVCFVEFGGSEEGTVDGRQHSGFQFYYLMFLSCQRHFHQKNLLNTVK